MTCWFGEALGQNQKALGSRTTDQICWPQDVVAILAHDIELWFNGALRFSMTGSIHGEFMEHDYPDYGTLWITVQKVLGVKSSF